MPIEGPLRELGLPDVFQLLDLSRKTGLLRVRSQLRDDEGIVYFDGGRVVQARMRSKPHRPWPPSWRVSMHPRSIRAARWPGCRSRARASCSRCSRKGAPPMPSAALPPSAAAR